MSALKQSGKSERHGDLKAKPRRKKHYCVQEILYAEVMAESWLSLSFPVFLHLRDVYGEDGEGKATG